MNAPTPRLPALPHLSFVWFVPVMGWTGLALAWLAAATHWGDTARHLSTAAAALAFAWLVFMLLAQGVRHRRHVSALPGDARHPVRQHAFAAAPISGLLLLAWATSAWQWQGPLPQALFLVASIWQWLTTAWILSRWLKPGPAGENPWAPVTPMLIVPIVGNVIAPLAGLPLGFTAWSWAQLGVGLVMWPVVIALLMVRVTLVGGVPPPLQPTWFIQMAPSSVLGIVALLAHAPTSVAWICWGFACFVFTWLVSQWKTIARLPFGMPHWGMSFPVMAFTSLTWRLANTTEGAWLLPLAMVMLVGGSALLLWLTVHTFDKRHLLLSPERG